MEGDEVFTPDQIKELKRLIMRHSPDPQIERFDQINTGILIPKIHEQLVTTATSTSSTSYADPASGSGPTITLPFAGTYKIVLGALMYQTGGGVGYMSFTVGSAAASDNDSISEGSTATGIYMSRVLMKTVTERTVLVCKYKTTSNTLNIQDRFITAERVTLDNPA